MCTINLNKITPLSGACFYFAKVKYSQRYWTDLSNQHNIDKKMSTCSQSVDLAFQKYYTPKESDSSVPIIIMHGLLGSKNNWNSMAKAIHNRTNKRTIYAVDVRNHGDSPHTDEFTYTLMVSDLLQFLNSHKITKASLIGHSLGGRISMLMSMMHPELVHSLVVVDISPLAPSPNMLALPKLFETIKSLDLDPKLVLREARKQASQKLKEKLQDEGLVSFLVANLAEDKCHSNWRWKFNLDSIIKNYGPEVCCFPNVGVPFDKHTLFIAGGNSDFLRPSEESEIKCNFFPAAQFLYVPGAGHWVHAEKPHEFLSAVSDFFNDDEKK